MPQMGFMPTSTPVPSALNSVPAGTVYMPSRAMFTVPDFYLSSGYYRSRSFPMNVPGMREAIRWIRRLLVAANCRISDRTRNCRKITSYLRHASGLLRHLEREARSSSISDALDAFESGEVTYDPARTASGRSSRPPGRYRSLLLGYGGGSSLGALALRSNPAHYGGVRWAYSKRKRQSCEGYDDAVTQYRKAEKKHAKTGCFKGSFFGFRRKKCKKTANAMKAARSDGKRAWKECQSYGALALRSNPAHYGSPDADDVQRGLQGAGAAGFGIMGALIGAAVGAGIQFRGKPLKDGWLYGSMAGFLLPVILLAPKKEEAV